MMLRMMMSTLSINPILILESEDYSTVGMVDSTELEEMLFHSGDSRENRQLLQMMKLMMWITECQGRVGNNRMSR